jgi:hypothetical protein
MASAGWLGRYRDGDHVMVWREMVSRGPEVRESTELFIEAEAVAHNTMRRARQNIEHLQRTLCEAGYRFNAEQPEAQWPSRVVSDPSAGDEARVDAVEQTIGPIPLSIRAFLLEAGGVSFTGTLPGWDVRYNDALEIWTSLETLPDHLLDMRDQDWAALVEGSPAGTVLLELAPDYLHKANISGGMPYGVFLPDRGADALWRFDDLHDGLFFVEYLRSVIADGGLPGWRRTPGDGPPPAIEELTTDLIPF